jgi:hypothetical protein
VPVWIRAGRSSSIKNWLKLSRFWGVKELMR